MEVGGTHVTCARVDAGSMQVEAGNAHRRDLVAGADADSILDTLAASANEVAAAHNGQWGIGMPGPFDYPAGVGRFEGVGKFDALYGVDVRTALAERIGPRPRRIDFLNDADAFVLGEWAVGALAGAVRCAGLTLGTGVGSGFVVDGAVVHEGAGVPRDGRANHITVDGRPLEDFMSRRAIRAAYEVVTGDGAADVAEIADLARSGSSDAISVLASALRALGAAVGPYLQRFEPQMVVIGGSMSASWPLFEPWFIQGCTDADPVAPRTAVANDATHAGLSGAAYFSLRRTA